MYFTFYGMMAVGITPTQHFAAVISSAFYSLWNLVSGFLIPKSVSKTTAYITLYIRCILTFFFLCLGLISTSLAMFQHIPVWWIWFHYLCPVSWTLRGIITSQLGDVEEMIQGPGFQGTVKEYISVTLGYDQTINGMSSVLLSVVVLICFNILFFGSFAVSVKVLNFQKR